MTTRFQQWSSTLGQKYLIAATGLLLLLYLVLHLTGNLLLLLGPTTFNGYAHVLITNPLIVPVELGLAAVFILHIYNAVTMWWSDRKARPQRYYLTHWSGQPTSRKTVASTTMIYTGLLTLVFVVFHVKTFKYGTYYIVPGSEERDLYRLVLEFFHNPVNVGFYEACLVLLGLHLWHGFSSAMESLGVDHPRYTRGVLAVGKVLAILIGGGFCVIPVWVYVFGGRS
jgi:succinate dehydrogenase / fumarate reductase, cytochrome b subunit